MDPLSTLVSAAETAPLLLLPGLVPGLALARRLRVGWLGVIPTAFAVSAGLHALVYALATVLEPSLEGGLLAVAVLAVVAAALTWRRAFSGPSLEFPLWGSLLAGSTFTFSLFAGAWMVSDADTYYHLAAARSLLERGAVIVRDPMLGTAVQWADPTSGMLHWMLAGWSRLGVGDVAYIWTGLTALGSLLLVCALWVLARAFTDDDRMATLAVLLYLVVGLFLDLRDLAYPSRFAQALAALSLRGLLDVWDRRSIPASLLAVAGALGVGALHVGVAEYLALVVLVVVAGLSLLMIVPACRRLAEGRMARLWGTAGLMGLGVLATTWSRLLTLSQSTMIDLTGGGPAAAAELPGVVRITGALAIQDPSVFLEAGSYVVGLAAMLGVAMAVVGWWERDLRLFAGALVLFTPALIAWDPLVTGWLVDHAYYMTGRLIDLSPIVLPLGLGWMFHRALSAEWRTAETVAGVVIVVVMGVTAVAPYVQNAVTPRLQVEVLRRGTQNVPFWISSRNATVLRMSEVAVGELRRIVGDEYAVVAAPPDIGYSIAGLAPLTIVATPSGHSPMAVELREGPYRRADMDAFFDRDATSEERLEVIEEYGIDYVFYWAREPEELFILEDLRQEPLLEEVGSYSNPTVFEVSP